MKTIVNGAYPTMVTPFTDDGAVDFEGVEKIIRFYLNKGCDGVFALCQSSEIFFLSLEEKVAILRRIMKYLAENPDRKIEVVASSHTSDSLEEQAEELTAMYENGASAAVWISNRLDIKQEGNTVWLKNAEKLLSMLPEAMQLGIYECPYPYKKLLDDEILGWLKATGRFSFIKDTCCDLSMLEHRIKLLEGSTLKLFNANTQTLLASLRWGASGYSGVMGNFHPEYYVWLCKNVYTYPEKAKVLQEILTYLAFSESLTYPVCAKYRMQLMGIDIALNSRSAKIENFGEYQRHIIKQGYDLERYVNEKMNFIFD